MLDYRQKQVEQAQLALAQEEQVAVKIQQIIQGFHQEIQEAFTAYNQATLTQQLNLETARHFSRYVGRLKVQIQHQEKILAKQNQRVAAARKQLRLAVVKHKSLELLRDKQQRHYAQQTERDELNQLEEIALQQYLRQKQSAKSSNPNRAQQQGYAAVAL